jgi:hypothetical protein
MNKTGSGLKSRSLLRYISFLTLNGVFILNLFAQPSAFQLAPLFQDNIVILQQ